MRPEPLSFHRRLSQPLDVPHRTRSLASDSDESPHTLSGHAADMAELCVAMKDARPSTSEGTTRAFSGMSDVARTFQSRIRRASSTLKTSLHASSSSSRSRAAQDSWFHASKPHGIRRRASDMVPRLLPSTDSFGVDDYVKGNNTSVDSAPGAAARAWAAKENERLGVSRRDSNQTNAQALSPGRESGIDLSMDSTTTSEDDDLRESQLCRRDPFEILPTEIQTHILSFLDATSLRQAAQVSKRWCNAESDQLIWREVFLHRYNYKSPTPRLPAPVGGRGIGKDLALGDKDWKKMYKARAHLDRNWEKGVATAIYLQGHGDSVYCVQFDEDKIVTGSRDRTIRFWDINTYKCTKVMAHSSMLSQDTLYASVNTEPPVGGTGLKIHPNPLPRTPDPTIYHTPAYYHEASILCLQYDAEIMVTGSSDHTLIVWSMTTHQPIRRLAHHTSGVLDVAFDADKIVSCSKDTTICIWSRASGALLQQLSGHRGPVNALQLRGNLLVSASGEGCAKLWNLDPSRCPATGALLRTAAKCVKEFWSHERGLACVEFSDDGRHILAGGNDTVVYKFDALSSGSGGTGGGEDNDALRLEGHANLVRSLYLDAANRRVVSGSYDMSLRVWDFDSGKVLMHLPNWTTSWMLSAKSDYRRIVSTSQDGRVLVMDFGDGVDGVEMLEGGAW